MEKPVEACCSSPAAICYWFIVSLIAWGVLSLIGIYWRPLHTPSAAACLFAMAIGCLANWLKNRSFHCAITGPLFLIAGVAFLLAGVRMIGNTFWVGDSFSSESGSRFCWNGGMRNVPRPRSASEPPGDWLPQRTQRMEESKTSLWASLISAWKHKRYKQRPVSNTFALLPGAPFWDKDVATEMSPAA